MKRDKAPCVICVGGSATIDHIFLVDEVKLPSAKITARDFVETGGGMGANAAVAVQRLGGQAVYWGRVGDDQTGDEVLWLLTREGIDAYLEAGRVIGKLGRGVEPMLVFMEEWPSTAKAVGECAPPTVMALIQRMQKSPNGKAITPFLQTLAPVARRLSRSPWARACSPRPPSSRARRCP